MTCSERHESIYLHVGGVLDDDERAELDAHLASGCPRCSDALAEAREELAALVLSLAPVVPPARVRERLLARAREQAPRSPLTPARHTPRVRRWAFARRLAPVAGIAFAAAALAVGVGGWRLAKPAAPESSGEVEELRMQLDEQDSELAELESRVERAAEVSNLLGARELDVMHLVASQPRVDAWGRAFWDHDDYRCYFRAHGLPPLAAGSSYVLWMIGPEGRAHAAGPLEPDGHGDLALYTRLPREFSPIVKSFVTAEATPHGERPTGLTLLLGEAGGGR